MCCLKYHQVWLDGSGSSGTLKSGTLNTNYSSDMCRGSYTAVISPRMTLDPLLPALQHPSYVELDKVPGEITNDKLAPHEKKFYCNYLWKCRVFHAPPPPLVRHALSQVLKQARPSA